MSHLEQATGILGEHFKNYIVIVQDDENPDFFDMVHSCPFATTGLLLEAQKYHHAQLNAIGNLEDSYEWIEEEPEGEEDEGDEF